MQNKDSGETQREEEGARLILLTVIVAVSRHRQNIETRVKVKHNKEIVHPIQVPPGTNLQ